ncbi:two-component sensor histidine kinase [Actinomadura sp. NBRC 104412]|uniref:sensor histidine kinase n=1 Tax=Actinomadura sp. NBRC 104412 TaxID=3032203 RepID=UPI0024A369DA|nr:sensor histidine kinase [Actinomadura sp. NBRC 104412]GLZ05845.1 two-component sensor histidine kinase [Actinomadura sp. NBRC 104412]
MAGEGKGEGSLRDTLGLLVIPLWEALLRPAAPRDPDRPWPPLPRWARRRVEGRVPFAAAVQVIDLLIALACYFGTYSLLMTEVAKRDLHPWNGELILSALVASVPLALRERHPMAAWRIFLVGMVLVGPYRWTDVTFAGGTGVTGLLVLYTVAARCSRSLTIGVGLLSMAGILIIAPENDAGTSFLVPLPLVVGYAVQYRRNARRELAEQEKRHQEAEAVLTERQRIARELHDVVAHHMSMIAIQAEAAPLKVATVPDETRGDLAEIRATALAALTEMRRILGVLRTEDGSQTAPQPDLGGLEELLEGGRGAGLTIVTRLDAGLAGLPSGVGLTSYRIVQEALSNAMRHAPGSKVEVAIRREGGILRLDVVSGPPADGRRPTPSPPGAGHGLVGMRERAAMLGGDLVAEPTPEGGFAVRATLPITGTAA